MSLLEDIFLRDEADEARELERIIEGDEYDEKPQQRSDSDDNSEKEDEAEEEKKRVDPSTTKTKRAVRNPRFVLNPARLTGPRGIQVIPDHFKDFKFKGKGHEKEDLDLVLKKLEHWAYRLYPKFQFEDCLKKIETLGKKRPVMVHLHKIRSDQYISEETVVQKDSSDEESAPLEREEDEFDKLLQQQIELARSTPGPGSVKKTSMETSFMERSSIMAPKATSSPSISEEQKERMMRNRKLAEERRLARLKNTSNVTNNAENYTVLNTNRVEVTNVTIDIRDTDDINVNKKQNRSNIIDSSDDEDGITMVNESITVDIHADVSMETHSRHDKNCIEVNTNDDFDSILIDDSNKIDNTTSKDTDDISKQTLNEPNKVSEENESEIDNIEKHSKQRQNDICETNTESIRNDENTKDIDNETTDDKESHLDVNFKIVENETMVSENQNTDKTKDIMQDTHSLIRIIKESVENVNNEEINSHVHCTKDANDDLMDVDFSEDF